MTAPDRKLSCANKDKPRQADGCVWEWVVCAGRGAVFNVYRCAKCGKEDWL